MRRRTFLKGSLALIGGGFLTACPGKKRLAPDRPEGGRVDPNFQAGHRLIHGDFPETPHRVEKISGVILGGGVAGLSAAWRWQGQGFQDFCLLELEKEVGGNSRSLSYPATDAPLAAHYLPLPNREARAVRRLLSQMGVLGGAEGQEALLEPELLCHSPQERLFYRGSWHDGLLPWDSLSSDCQAQVEDFSQVMERWRQRRDPSGRKAFALPLELSSRDPEILALDRLSFAEFAASQGWDSPALLWYLEYACRDDFGGSLENCSAWAGVHHFSARDGGGLGAPGEVLVWPEGNARLVSQLSRNLESRVRVGTLVVEVRVDEYGVEVDYLELASGQRVRLQAQVAIFCLPSFLRPKVLGEPEDLGFDYPPWVTANISLSATPEDLQGEGFMAWDNVLFDSPSLGYVVATHQSMHQHPKNPTVWTWYQPFPNEDPQETRRELLEAKWEDWVEIILGELEPLHPNIRELCHRLDVSVLGHGMIRPGLGTVWGDKLAGARRAKGRLFFGHGDLSGMSLFEESQYRGVLAAEQALEKLSASPVESWL